MKDFVKNWILPPKILTLVKKYISLYKLKKMDLDIIKKNKELKDKYKGKRCFVLGNAPTIKDIDIKLLKDEYVFVMSTFYNHPDYAELKKSIFSSVHLTGSKIYEENLKWMKAISDNTKTTNIFFFDIQQKKMIEENNLFCNKRIYYIATGDFGRSYDISVPTAGYPTNIIQSLEIALYLGFSEIYLHSVNLNTICNNGRYDYFFERDKMPYKDPEVHDNGLVENFFMNFKSTYGAMKGIYEILQYAKKNGVKICYTNKESLLKFLEFKEFNEVV
ncbi:hypothetical protein U5B43_04735 [Campylobacter sp. 9BO]|uniref:hypothetical protein n=1 Tax=Campylobacter sp. 9BO TaxID=3424759 RepID=UPI003D346F3E